MTIRRHESGCDVDILVVPRSSRAKLGPVHGDRVKVSVTAAPVDGAANAAVIDVFVKALKCKRADVDIIRGQSSRRKTVRLCGIDPAHVERLCH